MIAPVDFVEAALATRGVPRSPVLHCSRYGRLYESPGTDEWSRRPIPQGYLQFCGWPPGIKPRDCRPRHSP
jgi:hypothetical protein